jgi:hypothetical protein
MTQPAEKRAEPTPGPWTPLPYDPDWECARVVDALHGICDVFGEPKIATARAGLFAAAPNTAAERDRLKAANAELVTALKVCEREMSEAYRLGLVDSLAPKSEASSFTQAVSVARATLAKAKESTP